MIYCSVHVCSIYVDLNVGVSCGVSSNSNPSSSMFSSLPVFFIFTHVLVFILLFLSLLCHCFKVMICMYVCYMLFNKYSIYSSMDTA